MRKVKGDFILDTALLSPLQLFIVKPVSALKNYGVHLDVFHSKGSRGQHALPFVPYFFHYIRGGGTVALLLLYQLSRYGKLNGFFGKNISVHIFALLLFNIVPFTVTNRYR